MATVTPEEQRNRELMLESGFTKWYRMFRYPGVTQEVLMHRLGEVLDPSQFQPPAPPPEELESHER